MSTLWLPVVNLNVDLFERTLPMTLPHAIAGALGHNPSFLSLQ